MWSLNKSSCCFSCSLYLWEQLKEAEGLLVGLGQSGDGAAPILRAAEKHTLPAEAPHGVAAGNQAARLPTCCPASPFCQRVPTHADDAAPVNPQYPPGHPAEICWHTWMGTEIRRKQWAVLMLKTTIQWEIWFTFCNMAIVKRKGWKFVN